MKKPLIVPVVVAVIIGLLTFGSLELTASPKSKASTTATKTPGVPVSLVACGSAQSGVECIAVYKGQCAVFAFDPSSGKIVGAQPVDKKYCGLS